MIYAVVGGQVHICHVRSLSRTESVSFVHAGALTPPFLLVINAISLSKNTQGILSFKCENDNSSEKSYKLQIIGIFGSISHALQHSPDLKLDGNFNGR